MAAVAKSVFQVTVDYCTLIIGSGRSSAEWDLDGAVYPPPRKLVFDGARERLGSAATTTVDYAVEIHTQAKGK